MKNASEPVFFDARRDFGSANLLEVSGGSSLSSCVAAMEPRHSNTTRTLSLVDEVASSAGALDSVGGKTAFAMGTVAFGGAGTVGLSLEVDGGGSIVVGDMFDFAGAVPYSLEARIKPDVANDEFYEFFSKRSGPENGYVFYARKNSHGTTTVQFEQNAVRSYGPRSARRSRRHLLHRCHEPIIFLLLLYGLARHSGGLWAS